MAKGERKPKVVLHKMGWKKDGVAQDFEDLKSGKKDRLVVAYVRAKDGTLHVMRGEHLDVKGALFKKGLVEDYFDPGGRIVILPSLNATHHDHAVRHQYQVRFMFDDEMRAVEAELNGHLGKNGLELKFKPASGNLEEKLKRACELKRIALHPDRLERPSPGD